MDYEKVLGEHKFPTYEQLKTGLLRLIDEGKISREDAARLLPELRESEDERIRKTLLEHFNERNSYRDEDETFNGVPFSSIITYLEKQKDASKAIEAVDRIDKYIDEHLANAHDMSDSNPDKKYYRGWDDALGKMAGILQDVYSNEKQKEQKEIPLMNGDADLYFDNWIQHNDTTKRGCFEEGIRYAQRLQKEQKPASTEDMPYITDEHFYEREPADSFKYKLAEYMTKCCTKKEGPYGYTYEISTESILEMAKEELLKRGVVQKPVEWSEEDDWKREELIQYLEEKGDYRTVWMSWLKSLRPQSKDGIYEEKDEAFKPGKLQLALSFMNYLEENRPEGKMSLSNGECEDINKAFKENDWAKIIRYIEKYQPHWKPSDEQMRALADTLEDMPEHYKPKCTLETLERDLKKLM